MKAKLVLPAKPKNVALARDWVFENCRQFGCKGRRLLDIKTITSEIVTNVVKHAYCSSKKKNFILKVKLNSNKLSIIVRDYGSGFNKHRSKSLHVGLIIVRSLADKVKIRSFGIGCEVKVIVFLKSAELRRPLCSRFGLVKLTK